MAIKIDVKYQSPFVDYDDKKSFAQYSLANQVMADSNQFVPAKSNVLRLSANLNIDFTEIVYNMKYARRQYYAPGGWNYTTAGTGPKWDRKASSMYGDSWAQIYARGLGYH